MNGAPAAREIQGRSSRTQRSHLRMNTVEYDLHLATRNVELEQLKNKLWEMAMSTPANMINLASWKHGMLAV